MASFGSQQNVSDFDTSQSGGGLLPLGIYGGEVSDSDLKEVGGGLQAQFTVTIMAPAEYEGRTTRINEWHEHANDQSQRIGKSNIAKLAKACDLTGYGATEDFHNRPFVFKLELDKPYQRKVNGVPQFNDDGTPDMARYNKVGRYFYPGEEIPQPFVGSAEIPAVTTAANDNRRPTANDNAAAAAGGVKKKPW